MVLKWHGSFTKIVVGLKTTKCYTLFMKGGEMSRLLWWTMNNCFIFCDKWWTLYRIIKWRMVDTPIPMNWDWLAHTVKWFQIILRSKFDHVSHFIVSGSVGNWSQSKVSILDPKSLDLDLVLVPTCRGLVRPSLCLFSVSLYSSLDLVSCPLVSTSIPVRVDYRWMFIQIYFKQK